MMTQLYGLTMTTFYNRATPIFDLVYACKNIIRIYDKKTRLCIVNMRVPFIIDKTDLGLFRAVFLHHFKYECTYDCKRHGCRQYESIRSHIETFLKDVYDRNRHIEATLLRIIQDCFVQRPLHPENVNLVGLLEHFRQTFSEYCLQYYHKSMVEIN